MASGDLRCNVGGNGGGMLHCGAKVGACLQAIVILTVSDVRTMINDIYYGLHKHLVRRVM